MTDRTLNPDTLLSDTLKQVAGELDAPAVILEWRRILFPGQLTLPTWVASVLIDGKVECQICDDDPLRAYSTAMIVLEQHLGLEPSWRDLDARLRAWRASQPGAHTKFARFKGVNCPYQERLS
ncbi:MAG: hypothetical protein ABL309_13960 [Phycisphaerales bacterium]